MKNAILTNFLLVSLFMTGSAFADDIGCVSTNIRLLGIANDKICITSFKDPDVDGVVCYVSRAETGGAKGVIGIAEDTSDAAISCHQVGPINMKDNLKDGEKVFKESRSILFKKLQVVRFFDKDNNSLVYLAYSDKLIDGSPKNTISAVPLMPWGPKP